MRILWIDYVDQCRCNDVGWGTIHLYNRAASHNGALYSVSHQLMLAQCIAPLSDWKLWSLFTFINNVSLLSQRHIQWTSIGYQNLLRMVAKGSNDQNWSQIDANSRKYSKWSQTIANGRKQSQIVANGRKLSQIVANCGKRSHMVVNGLKWSQTVAHSHKLSQT